MENILHKCETMPPFNRLFKNRTLSDDKERYLKMAIRIDPRNHMVLYRKKEYKSFVKELQMLKALTRNVLTFYPVVP